MIQTNTTKILKSQLDNSVNFVIDNGIECRFVQREKTYFIIYVSSHYGCNMACRMCHLTQTGQTDMKEVTYSEYVTQIQTVLNFLRANQTDYDFDNVEKIHINFMARGEPMMNKTVLKKFGLLSDTITNLCKDYIENVNVEFLISSIFPKEGGVERFGVHYGQMKNLHMYLSLYSMNRDFRKRWLPKATEPMIALEYLDYFVNKRIHHPLIEGENDSVSDAESICNAISSYQEVGMLRNISYNHIHYNPFSENQGKNSENYLNYLTAMHESNVFHKIKSVKKVGFDVMASCGMFIPRQNSIEEI